MEVTQLWSESSESESKKKEDEKEEEEEEAERLKTMYKILFHVHLSLLVPHMQFSTLSIIEDYLFIDGK